MITLLDLQISNLDSVRQALGRIGVLCRVTDRADEVLDADVLILPGVGAFSDGMASLQQRSLSEPIRRRALGERKPVLGICLGMQLFADESEEYGVHRGLGLIAGRVVRLRPQSAHFRVPNMGWCDVTFETRFKPFGELTEPPTFYFAHSYHLQCLDHSDVAASIDYDGQQLVVAVQQDNLFGVQFHPEKSQDAGLELLEKTLAYFCEPRCLTI